MSPSNVDTFSATQARCRASGRTSFDFEVERAMRRPPEATDAKCLYKEMVRLQGKKFVQSNWGRIQQSAGTDYAIVLDIQDEYARGSSWLGPGPQQGYICFWPDAVKMHLVDDYLLSVLEEGIETHPGERVGASIERIAEFLITSGPITMGKLAVKLRDQGFSTENIKVFRGWLDRIADTALPDETKEVKLESFDGFLDQIDGDTAYVTLKSEHGDVLYGQYPAKELAAKGIREGRRFRCVTVAVGDRVRVDIAPIPDKEISAERERAIRKEIEKRLGGNEPDDDY